MAAPAEDEGAVALKPVARDDGVPVDLDPVGSQVRPGGAVEDVEGPRWVAGSAGFTSADIDPCEGPGASEARVAGSETGGRWSADGSWAPADLAPDPARSGKIAIDLTLGTREIGRLTGELTAGSMVYDMGAGRLTYHGVDDISAGSVVWSRDAGGCAQGFK